MKKNIIIPLILVLLLTGCGFKDFKDNSAVSIQIFTVSQIDPSDIPTLEPTSEPSSVSTVEPTSAPTAEPTSAPTAEPTSVPTAEATPLPTAVPTKEPDVNINTAFYGKLSVSGANLVDAEGNIVQLKGVSSHGLAWFPEFVNKDALKTMRDDWGINIFRIAMYTAENGGYCLENENGKQKLKDKVSVAVDDATDLGLYVIIDWHVLNDQDPNKYIEEAKAFFGEMSEMYKDYDNVFYEVCNEPNGNVTWEMVKAYAEEVIGVIRQHDDDGIVLVGTPTWSQDIDKVTKDPITDYDNVMYTLHFYAATHTDYLRQKMTNAYSAGIPVFVTEYGICDASGNGGIDEKEASKWVSAMDDCHISYCIWNLSNKNETSALIASSCKRTSGWTQDELSNSGKWFVKMMRGDLEGIGNNDYTESSQGSGDGSGQQSYDNQPANNNTLENISANGEAGSVKASVATVNSWYEGENPVYQLDITLENNGSSDVTGWNVRISFDTNVEISSYWCSNASVSGNVLTLTPADWNATVTAGGNVSGIGIIIKGDKALTIQSVNIG